MDEYKEEHIDPELKIEISEFSLTLNCNIAKVSVFILESQFISKGEI